MKNLFNKTNTAHFSFGEDGGMRLVDLTTQPSGIIHPNWNSNKENN